MYSTALSITVFGTNTPAFRAARRAIIWATVTDTSAWLGRGSYRHPPSRFWALTVNVDRLLQHAPDPLLLRGVGEHAAHLGQEQGAEPVLVHGPVVRSQRRRRCSGSPAGVADAPRSTTYSTALATSPPYLPRPGWCPPAISASPASPVMATLPNIVRVSGNDPSDAWAPAR